MTQKPVIVLTVLAILLHILLRVIVIAKFNASVWSASGPLARLIIMSAVPVAAVIAGVLNSSYALPGVIISIFMLATNLCDLFVDSRSRRAPNHVPTDWS